MSSRASSTRASSIAATAVPPGTACQHCSRVSATRTSALVLEIEAFAEGRNRALESFPERDRRLPPEDLAREGQVRLPLRRVVDREGLEHDLRARTCELEHQVGELEHRELAVVADVDRSG